MPAITLDTRGTVLGQALGLEVDGSEELRLPEFVHITDHHEHIAKDALAEFHTTCPLVPDDLPAILVEHPLDDLWPTCPRRDGP